MLLFLYAHAFMCLRESRSLCADPIIYCSLLTACLFPAHYHLLAFIYYSNQYSAPSQFECAPAHTV